MTYRAIDYSHIEDAILFEVFEHANVYLSDVYSMLAIEGAQTGGGSCNFSIALVLLCLVDGLARDVYPTLKVPDQQMRFCKLLREYLPWIASDDQSLDIARAAKVLYLELRNPLAHELAQDKVTTARPEGYLEPAVLKTRGGRSLSIDEIDAMEEWKSTWPAVSTITRPNGRQRYVVDCGALYWAVKKMTAQLAINVLLLNQAVITRQAMDAGHGSFHLERIAEKLRRWGRLQSELRRIWVHGCRVNGTNDLGSPLRLAIELSIDPSGIGSEGEGAVSWHTLAISWTKELGRAIRLPISLSEHRPEECRDSCDHVGRQSMLVFER